MPAIADASTFGSVLKSRRGFGPGFDFMRLWLAVTVLAWHCRQLSYGELLSAEATPFWIVDYSVVPMFFGLSGFLVAASGMRLSLCNFLINRGLRILPALVVEILISALLLGPVFTVVKLADYFTSIKFWHYLTNMIGIINYELPGVFVGNPISKVNYSLWTVPYEIGCYAILSALMVTGMLKAPRMVAAATVCLMLSAVAVETSGLAAHAPGPVVHLLNFLFLNGGAKLLPCFLLGVLAYQWREHIPYDARLFAICLLLCLALASFGNISLKNATWLQLPMLPAMIYIVIFLGLTPLPRLPIFDRGDYSYGIYLYHVPFLQAVLVCLPGLAAWKLFAIGLPLVTALAALSWHLVEKPILAQRKRFALATIRAAPPAALVTPAPATHAAWTSAAVQPRS
jgi:peptidoglycan/LPS O-acetylase OafA/YrhL